MLPYNIKFKFVSQQDEIKFCITQDKIKFVFNKIN